MKYNMNRVGNFFHWQASNLLEADHLLCAAQLVFLSLTTVNVDGGLFPI